MEQSHLLHRAGNYRDYNAYDLKSLMAARRYPGSFNGIYRVDYRFVTLKLNYHFYVFNFWLFSAAELLSPL